MTPPSTPRREPKSLHCVACAPATPMRGTPLEPSTPMSRLTTSLHSSSTPPPCIQRRDPLMEAIQSERYEEVKTMLEIGDSSVDMPAMICSDHESALVFAIRSLAPVEILRLLLRHGAVADEPDSKGETPLMLLAGSTQVSRHADKPCIWSMVPEAVAGEVAIESFYPFQHLALDGNIAPPMHFGLLPLPKRGIHGLTDERCMAYASCLLLHGANPSIKSKDGTSIASRAAKSGQHALSNFLRQWQSVRFLRASWRRSRQEDQAFVRRSLLSLDCDSLEMIFVFLVPPEHAYMV